MILNLENSELRFIVGNDQYLIKNIAKEKYLACLSGYGCGASYKILSFKRLDIDDEHKCNECDKLKETNKALRNQIQELNTIRNGNKISDGK